MDIKWMGSHVLEVNSYRIADLCSDEGTQKPKIYLIRLWPHPATECVIRISQIAVLEVSAADSLRTTLKIRIRMSIVKQSN